MSDSQAQLLAENALLQEQLAEARQILEAIRSDRVDALLVEKPLGEEICFLSGPERLAEEAASIGYLRWSLRSGRVHLSPGLLRICGQAPDAAFERDYSAWQQEIHPEDRQRLRACQEQVFCRGEEPLHCEYRIVHPDGSFRWVEERSSVTYNASGQPVRVIGVVVDVTERRRAQEAIRESEGRFRIMADGLPLIIWVHGAQGQQQFVNQTFREFFRVSPQDMGADNWHGLIHPEDVAAYRKEFAACLREGRPFHAEARVRRGDGQWRWIESWGRPRFSLSGDFLGIVGASADMTERKQTEELLAAAQTHSEEANRAKSQFLANMSHELRTPMNAILGMTELALREDLSPAVRDYLRTAKDSADTLLELLDQLLDFSRIEAGKMELENCSFDLCHTVEQVAKTLALRAGEKGLELICDLAAGIPERVVGDPLRIRQVLVNLIGNAIKFTPRGEVVVSAAAAASNPERVEVEFTVEDTGIGISQEDQQRIFSPFIQADASTTRRHGGSGLGLAIVSNLVASMRGQIQLESSPGRGSRFSFTVPFALPADAESVPAPPWLAPEPLPSLPVLIVVENATNCRVLERTLRAWGTAPEAVRDVPAALARLQRAADSGRKFELLLADSSVPDLAGAPLAGWLGRSPSLACPIVLMLSPHEESGQAERYRAMAAACLEKPISQVELWEAITGALGLKTTSVNGAAPPAEIAPVRTLRVLLAEDTPANQKLVMYLLNRRGHVVEIAANGQQALELIQQHDFDLVLMDVQMPSVDGFQATRMIRSLDGSRATVPIVAMTAHALPGDAERCLAAGMDAYLSKPIDGDSMIELVERLAGQRGSAASERGGAGQIKSTAPVRVPLDPAADPPAQEVFDLQRAIQRCFGDYSLFQKMVSHYFAEVDQLLEQMQIEDARGDIAALSSSAHRLKNTVGYLGAEPAFQTLRRLERFASAGQVPEASDALHELTQQLHQIRPELERHYPQVQK